MKLILGVIVAALFAIGILLGLSAWSWYDETVKLSNTTEFQWEQNQNSYDAFWKTVQEVAQVPQQYKEGFKELLIADTTGTFGPGGSNAMFQWFKQRDINLDPSVYSRVQTVIEAGRGDFKRSQDTLLDKQRILQNRLQSVSGRFWTNFFDFPREVKGDRTPPSDRDGDGILTALDYPIITSKKTKNAFSAGEDEALNVFGK